jgi:hypothetical protein
MESGESARGVCICAILLHTAGRRWKICIFSMAVYTADPPQQLQNGCVENMAKKFIYLCVLYSYDPNWVNKEKGWKSGGGN